MHSISLIACCTCENRKRGWVKIGSDSNIIASSSGSSLRLREADFPGLSLITGHPGVNGEHHFQTFGRISRTRDGFSETFYCRNYSNQHGSHKKNSYCVRFRGDATRSGVRLAWYGLVLQWLVDKTNPNAAAAFAIIAPFGSVDHPEFPHLSDGSGDLFFPVTYNSLPIIVSVDDVEFKCIYHNLGNETIDGIAVYRVTHLAHRSPAAYQDLEDEDAGDIVGDELL